LQAPRVTQPNELLINPNSRITTELLQLSNRSINIKPSSSRLNNSIDDKTIKKDRSPQMMKKIIPIELDKKEGTKLSFMNIGKNKL